MTTPKPRHWLAALLLLAAAACSRGEVDRDVDQLAEGTHRTADKLDRSLHKAKDEALVVKAKIERGGKELGEKLKAFGQDVKKDANDARESLRR